MRSPLSAPEFRDWRLSDGYVCRGRVWPGHRAGGGSRGICAYLHGIQSHGGWYEWSGSLLASEGWTVVMPDRRGSGLNAAARGDCPSMERWLLDVNEILAVEWGDRQHGEQRLLGLSWGGKVAAALAVREPARWSGLMLVTPGIFPAVDVGMLQRFRIARSLVLQPTQLFDIPLQEPSLFTDSPVGQAFIAADPLKLTQCSARFLYYSSRLDHRLRRLATSSLQCPVTMLLAENERIIQSEPTARWLRRVAGPYATIVEFPGAAHTLELEADTARYEAELLKWAKS